MAGGDFTHVEAPHTDHVHVRFTGPFQGRQIVWDARIATLDRTIGDILITICVNKQFGGNIVPEN